MTTLRHHPHDETLMSFAAGVLDPAMSLLRSCHLQFCAMCRRRWWRILEACCWKGFHRAMTTRLSSSHGASLFATVCS
jgi:anti-sigma factor ChrR (cupin superfamily)